MGNSQPSNEKMFLRIREIIVQQLGCKENEVTPTAHFTDDLGADSLDVVEMSMAIEEEFGINIPDEVAETLATVQDIVNFVVGNPDRSGRILPSTEDFMGLEP